MQVLLELASYTRSQYPTTELSEEVEVEVYLQPIGRFNAVCVVHQGMSQSGAVTCMQMSRGDEGSRSTCNDHA